MKESEEADGWDAEEEQEQHIQWLKSIGAENTGLESLEKYKEAKYNNTEEYRLFAQYAKDVERGWISPLSGFHNYQSLYHRIQDEVIGRRTANGILLTGQVPHFMQRVIGTTVDPKILEEELRVAGRSGVGVDDAKKALFSRRASIL